MYQLLRYIFVVVFLVGIAAGNVSAQSAVSLYEIDPSAFPIIRAKFNALGPDGIQITGLSSSDINLTESGISRSVSGVSVAKRSTGASLSVGVMVDARRHADLAAAAVQGAIGSLGMPRNEIGITSHDDTPYIVHDLTGDRRSAQEAVARLKPAEGTLMQSIFFEKNAGGIPFISARSGRKILILVTDLHSPLTDLDTARIVREAVERNIAIYPVLLHAGDPYGLFGRIAERTGGRVHENIVTAEGARAVLSRIVMEEQQAPNVIEWRSDLSCDAVRNVIVTVPSLNLTASALYTAPEISVPGLKIDPPGVSFGYVAAGTENVTLTALNRAIAITRISVDDPHFSFELNGRENGFTIREGESVTIPLSYKAADSSYRVARFQIESDACGEKIIQAAAGSVGNGLDARSLRLLYPNGGESLTAGSEADIKWDGILAADSVRLEYSIDHGRTWRLVTDKASGLRYHWTVPGVVGTECLARVIRIAEKNPRAGTVTTLPEHGHWVTTAAFNRDGSRVATGSYGESLVRVWNSETGALVTAVQGFSWINTIEYSPDGNRLMAADAGGNIGVWDINTGALIHRYLPVGKGGTPTARFSPDGKRMVVSGGYDNVARIWDLASGAILLTLSGHAGAVQDAVYSPDGDVVVTAAEDGAVRFWNPVTGKGFRTITAHPGGAVTVAFSRDGGHLITGGADGIAKVWDVTSGDLLMTLKGHEAKLSTVSFTTGGTHAITASWDHTAKIWDLTTGAIVRTLEGHEKEVRAAYISPDGRRAVTASVDRTAKLWELDLIPGETDRSDFTWSIVAPRIAVAPSSVDMGKVAIGAIRDSLLKGSIRNDGVAPVRISRIDIASGDMKDFALVAGGEPGTLQPGESRDLLIAFTPTTAGPRNASLTMVSTAGELRDAMRLTGTGVQPAIEVVATTVDFGRTAVGGTRDTTVQVLLRNVGTTTVTVTGITQLGPDVTSFMPLDKNLQFTIAPGGSKSMALRFAPRFVGRTSGRIAFNYTGALRPATTTLFGEGVGAAMQPIGPAVDIAAGPCAPAEPGVVEIYNGGNGDLIVTRAVVSGPDAASFISQELLSPLVIEPRSIGTLTVHFAPASAGVKSASLALESNSVGSAGAITVPLSGRKDSVGFSLSSPVVSFDGVPADQVSTTVLTLTNTGTAPLEWNAPIAGRQFTIESITPARTMPGETSRIVVRFNGAADGAVIEETLALSENGCGTTSPIACRASVRGPVAAAISAPELRAAPGQIVEVPVTVEGADLLADAGVREIATLVRIDASILYPVDGTPIGTVEGSYRVIPVSLPITGKSAVAVLRFRAALGSDSTTAIMFEKSTAIGGRAVLTETPGRFTLEIPCLDQDPRYFLTGGAIRLKQNHPNPVSGSTQIEFDLVEAGRTRLTVNDASGRNVATLLEGEYGVGSYSMTFDATQLTPGTYFYVLETPTQVRSRSMQIVR